VMAEKRRVEVVEIELAWLRAANACECTRAHHSHGRERCGRELEWTERGRHGAGAWEAQKTAGETAGLEILCWDCHAKEI
jgi:hypothetical protein